MRRRVLLVGYQDADGLDLFGPAEVFAEAVLRLGEPAYEVTVAAIGGGVIRLTSGLSVAACDLAAMRPQSTDIVLVAGGSDAATDAAAEDPALLGWLARAARTVGRIGSVCDGAFILASAGILDGRRAATHWSSCERLARLHPKVHVDREAIFVRDGRVWTAAGISTGIDMSLAMVEEDHGRKLADTVAAHLVLFVRRPGFQSQFSEELVAQTLASDPLAPVISWLRANLRAAARRGNGGAQGRNVGPNAASELLASARPHSGQAHREAPRRAGADAPGNDATRYEGHRGEVRVRLDTANDACFPARAGCPTSLLPADVRQAQLHGR